ncbi:MAG: hypothetical protein LBT40_08805 [Deltaproteobacteria bacterium]|nr:hypothetical protein [Deltaproteobacteria bacterium]
MSTPPMGQGRTTHSISPGVSALWPRARSSRSMSCRQRSAASAVPFFTFSAATATLSLQKGFGEEDVLWHAYARICSRTKVREPPSVSG